MYKCFLELFKCFQRSFMKKHYSLSESEFELINISLINCLEEFDSLWTQYEDSYVRELMVIEYQSRRFVMEAIQAEEALAKVEKVHKSSEHLFEDVKQKTDLQMANQTFTRVIAKINSVANFEGHGRDDLGVEILMAAEDVLLRITQCESQNLRRLARRIIDSYQMLRELFKKYNENIEIVDPQLRNNPDLVEALMEYEKNWEKGKIYLLNSRRCDQLIFFTNVIEGLCEKYAAFKESLECCDAEIFVQIPSIMLLKKVEKEDNDICEVYLPQIMESESNCFQIFNQVKLDLLRLNDKFVVLREKTNGQRKSGSSGVNKLFQTNDKVNFGLKTLLKANKGIAEVAKNGHKKLNFEFYNFLEKKLLCENESIGRNSDLLNVEDLETVERCLNNLRQLSIEMQRFNAIEWNAFLDIAISKGESLN